MDNMQEKLVQLGDAIDRALEEEFDERLGYFLMVVPLEQSPTTAHFISNMPRETVHEMWRTEMNNEAKVTEYRRWGEDADKPN